MAACNIKKVIVHKSQSAETLPADGEIISVDDNSLTVKLPDGSSKIVLLSDKTIINKASEGNKSDLKTGTNIAAFGSTNSDGTLTAKNIQINPLFRIPPTANPKN